jgi:hypothetical protein
VHRVCLGAGVLSAFGLVITVASALVTWALHLTGWGKPPGRRPREQWGMRVRDTGARQGHPGCVGCRMAGRGPWTGVVQLRAAVTEAGAVGTSEPVSADSVG